MLIRLHFASSLFAHEWLASQAAKRKFGRASNNNNGRLKRANLHKWIIFIRTFHSVGVRRSTESDRNHKIVPVIRRKFQPIVFNFLFFSISLVLQLATAHFSSCTLQFPRFSFSPHVYDSQTIALNVVESTCVVDSYTVVETPRTPVHNTQCPLYWVRDNNTRQQK